MKIIFISNKFPPLVDGVADHTHRLAHEFRKHGHEVYVICRKSKAYVDYHHTDHFHLLPVIDCWNLTGIWHLLTLIKTIHPEWILLQYVPYGFNRFGLPFPIALLTILLKFYIKIPAAVFFHEYASGIGFHGKYKYLPISIGQFSIAYLLKKTARLSIYTLDVLDNRFKNRSNSLKLYIGSNIPENDNVEEGSCLRKSLVHEAEYLLCTFGMKEQVHLLDTLHEVKRKGVRFRLLIIGKICGKHLDGIRTEAEKLGIWENIHVTGYLEGKQVRQYLKASDLYLSFNKVDTKGRGGISTKSGAIAAALMAGLPVVGTKGHMTGHIFLDGVNVILIDPGKTIENAGKILHLLHDKTLRSSLGKNASLTYAQYLSWDANYQKLIKKLV